MSSGCPLFPWCRANARHLSSDHTLHPRCLVPLPFPLPLLFPRATSTPHLPRGGRSQANIGRKIHLLSVYKRERLLYLWFRQSLFSCLFLLALLSYAIFSLPWWSLCTLLFLWFFHSHIPSPNFLPGRKKQNGESNRFAPPYWGGVGERLSFKGSAHIDPRCGYSHLQLFSLMIWRR